jgi:uncharacterized protein (DUF302 family)
MGMDTNRYAIKASLPATTMDDAVERVTAALAEEGFGVLTTIDVSATLRKKLDVDYRPYRILGACNPKLAHRGLQIDEQLGLLLPCNVVVQQKDDTIEVSFIDPQAMFQVVESDELKAVASEVDERLRRVAASVDQR